MAFESNITATNISGSDSTKAIWNYGSAPGLDPYGHVATWMSSTEQVMRDRLTSYPAGSFYMQREYDATVSAQLFAGLIEGTDAQLASDLRQWCQDSVDSTAETYPAANGLDADPNTRPSLWNGYQAYNGGFVSIVRDPWFPAGSVAQYQRRAVNPSRGCAYSNNYWDINRSKTYGNGEWPNDPFIPDSSALRVPNRTREWALAAINHIYSDDWFDTNEDIIAYELPAYDAHLEYPGRILEDWFFYPGGCFDQWHAITDDLESANGNFTLVPEAWYSGVSPNSCYCPFMMAHAMRAMITHFYDDRMGTQDIKPRIIREASWVCDVWKKYFWQRTQASPDRFCPVYDVPAGGQFRDYSDPDLALFCMPVAAFAWLHTGNDKYLDMAVDMCEAGNSDGWWIAGKQGNQLTIWAYHGFQWLGWTAEPFAIWWRDNP